MQRDAEFQAGFHAARHAGRGGWAQRPHVRPGGGPDLLTRAFELAGRAEASNEGVRALCQAARGDVERLRLARSQCLELLAASPADGIGRRALKLLSMSLHPSAAAVRAAARVAERPGVPVPLRPELAPRLCRRPGPA
jgi:hypothetical protein